MLCLLRTNIIFFLDCGILRRPEVNYHNVPGIYLPILGIFDMSLF